MKKQLLVVGATTIPYVKNGIQEFTDRIRRFPTPFEIKVVADVKTSKKTTPDAQKQAEGTAILANVQPSDHLVLLDERGRQYTSREFATFIEQKGVAGVRNLIFVVGGPYGFSEEVYKRANTLLSLSKMTFPHELVRLLFVEQIYRAYTITANMPYHHD